MNTKMKIALTVTAVGSSVIALAALRLKALHADIVNRFTEYDPKVAKKAFNIMLLKAFAGKYEGVDMDDDAVMTALFRKEVMNLLKK